METFSMRERSKNKHKFGQKKAYEAEEVRKHLKNLKIENKVFG